MIRCRKRSAIASLFTIDIPFLIFRLLASPPVTENFVLTAYAISFLDRNGFFIKNIFCLLTQLINLREADLAEVQVSMHLKAVERLTSNEATIANTG